MRLLALAAFIFLAIPSASAWASIAEKPRHDPVPRSDPFLHDSSLPGPGIGREVRDARKRIERARESGRISRREARQLRREARAIERLAYRYGSDGLSDSERRELEMRSRALGSRASRGR